MTSFEDSSVLMAMRELQAYLLVRDNRQRHPTSMDLSLSRGFVSVLVATCTYITLIVHPSNALPALTVRARGVRLCVL